MYSRTLVNGIVMKLRVTNLFVNTNKYFAKSIPITKNGSIVPLKHTSMRMYSAASNPEDMIVDYDYVNKATSDSSVLIVDVREPDEIKEHGKIPNSINIPLGEITNVLSTISDSEFQKIYNKPKPSDDTPIIFYCMIGRRSGMAQQNALKLGYTNVKNYLGSWTDWAAQIKS